MNDTTDNTIVDPPTSTRRRNKERPLYIVDVAEESRKRAAWLQQWALQCESAQALPAIGDLSVLAGTWLETLSWSKRQGKNEDPSFVPTSSLANAITVLVHDVRWKGVLAYDAFAESVVSQRMPPWHPTDSGGATVGDWTEEDTSRLESWLQRAYSIRLGDQKVMAAVSVASRRTVTHPVREYLATLEWDGAPRIDRWLVQLLGCPDDDYTSAVGRLWLVGAVARVMRPGCKMDTMLVLEGKTGIRKSSALRALATGNAVGDTPHNWFTEISAEIDPRETPQLLRRKWIAELGELASLRRTRDQETIKSFLSRQEDNYRPPYGKRARDFPRQSIFAGTTNEERYLRDVTGARRFWPARCTRIHIRGIEIERDQLWAEAMQAYKSGEAWHLVDQALIDKSVAEQSERFEDDSWTEIVRDWCDAKRAIGVTTEDIMGSCLGLEIGHWTHAETMRVGAILRRIGWEPQGRERPRLYKPEVAK